MKAMGTIITKEVELSKEEFNHLRNRIQSNPSGIGHYLTEGGIEFFYGVGKELNFINSPSHSREGFHIRIPTVSIIEIAENVPTIGSVWEIRFLEGE